MIYVNVCKVGGKLDWFQFESNKYTTKNKYYTTIIEQCFSYWIKALFKIYTDAK